MSDGGDVNLSPSQNEELETLKRSLPAIQAATIGRVFDYGSAKASGVSELMASNWARGVILAGGQVVGAPDLAQPTSSEPNSSGGCRGVNKMWSDWLGWHAKLNSCTTKQVIDALRVGVPATTVASLIVTACAGPIGAVSAIMPALLTWSASSIEACSRNGTGVEVAFAGFVCWAQ